MSSPLSAPFSVFPSQQTTYTCNYKSCPGRFTHPSDLDRHNAVHHSSMGHSPITALNIRVLLPTFPSPPSTSAPETDLPLPLPPTTHHTLDPHHQHQQEQEDPNPTRPPMSSSSLDSLIPYPHHSPPTVCSSSSYSSSTTSTTSSPTTHKTFKWPSLPISLSASGPKTKTPKPKMRRSTSTTMRCGRHGDEWLGVRGWRFWR